MQSQYRVALAAFVQLQFDPVISNNSETIGCNGLQKKSHLKSTGFIVVDIYTRESSQQMMRIAADTRNSREKKKNAMKVRPHFLI